MAAVISLEMFEGTTDARKEAEAIAEAERLTARMLETRDISKRAGAMERDSPLFYGTGENQTLF